MQTPTSATSTNSPIDEIKSELQSLPLDDLYDVLKFVRAKKAEAAQKPPRSAIVSNRAQWFEIYNQSTPEEKTELIILMLERAERALKQVTPPA